MTQHLIPWTSSHADTFVLLFLKKTLQLEFDKFKEIPGSDQLLAMMLTAPLQKGISARTA